MSIAFKTGAQFNFFMYLLVIALIVAYLMVFRHRKAPEIRHLPAVDAFPEMAGRAAETNRPIHFYTGWGGTWGGLYSATGAQTLAGISVLNKMARECARYKAKIVYTSPNIESYPIVQEAMESAYRAEGALEYYDPVTQILMKSPTQYGWCAMVLDFITKANVSANIEIGSGGGGDFMIFETGTRLGAIQLSGIPGVGESTAFCVALADHAVIGSECFVLGAICSEEPEQLGSLIGQDVINISLIALFALGLTLAIAKSTWLTDLMKI